MADSSLLKIVVESVSLFTLHLEHVWVNEVIFKNKGISGECARFFAMLNDRVVGLLQLLRRLRIKVVHLRPVIHFAFRRLEVFRQET